MSSFAGTNTEQYRERTRKMVWMVHVPKRCACNRVITDKISKRYGGKCEQCAGAGK